MFELKSGGSEFMLLYFSLKLGGHRRGKRKREEMMKLLQAMRKSQAAAAQ